MSIVTLSLMEPDYPINVVKVIDFSFRTPYAKIVSYVLGQNQHLKFDKLKTSWGLVLQLSIANTKRFSRSLHSPSGKSRVAVPVFKSSKTGNEMKYN